MRTKCCIVCLSVVCCAFFVQNVVYNLSCVSGNELEKIQSLDGLCFQVHIEPFSSISFRELPPKLVFLLQVWTSQICW